MTSEVNQEKPRLLFLSRWFPYPATNGSKLRIYNLLRALADAYAVTLISFNDQPEKEVDSGGLAAFCQEVKVVPWQPYNPESGQARKGFFSATPRFLIDTFSPSMQQCIEDTLRSAPQSAPFTAVIASQIDMAAYRPYFRQLPALFEEAEVGTLHEQMAQAASLKQRFRYGLTWAKHRRYLTQLLADFQVCTVVSEPEKELLATAVAPQTSIEVIPNCIHLDDYADVSETAVPRTLIFTGAFTYQPNHEAMVWFLEDVFPLVRAQLSDVQLTITGNHADKPLPTQENVTLTGFVPDVRPLIARSWASLVPIWTGGGTRLKILEAMALRTPVIATSKGAEGLQVQDGVHLLLADDAAGYATAVLRLLQDDGLRRRLADNGLALVRTHYHWPVVAPRFLELVEHLTQEATPPAYNAVQVK